MSVVLSKQMCDHSLRRTGKLTQGPLGRMQKLRQRMGKQPDNSHTDRGLADPGVYAADY